MLTNAPEIRLSAEQEPISASTRPGDILVTAHLDSIITAQLDFATVTAIFFYWLRHF